MKDSQRRAMWAKRTIGRRTADGRQEGYFQFTGGKHGNIKSLEFIKEHKEHPSFSNKQIKQIVADHEYKNKLERCIRKVKAHSTKPIAKYNPFAVCKTSVKR